MARARDRTGDLTQICFGWTRWAETKCSLLSTPYFCSPRADRVWKQAESIKQTIKYDHLCIQKFALRTHYWVFFFVCNDFQKPFQFNCALPYCTWYFLDTHINQWWTMPHQSKPFWYPEKRTVHWYFVFPLMTRTSSLEFLVLEKMTRWSRCGSVMTLMQPRIPMGSPILV